MSEELNLSQRITAVACTLDTKLDKDIITRVSCSCGDVLVEVETIKNVWQQLMEIRGEFDFKIHFVIYRPPMLGVYEYLKYKFKRWMKNKK